MKEDVAKLVQKTKVQKITEEIQTWRDRLKAVDTDKERAATHKQRLGDQKKSLLLGVAAGDQKSKAKLDELTDEEIRTEKEEKNLADIALEVKAKIDSLEVELKTAEDEQEKRDFQGDGNSIEILLSSINRKLTGAAEEVPTLALLVRQAGNRGSKLGFTEEDYMHIAVKQVLSDRLAVLFGPITGQLLPPQHARGEPISRWREGFNKVLRKLGINIEQKEVA